MSWSLPLRCGDLWLVTIQRYVAMPVLSNISVGSATIASTRSFSSR